MTPSFSTWKNPSVPDKSMASTTSREQPDRCRIRTSRHFGPQNPKPQNPETESKDLITPKFTMFHDGYKLLNCLHGLVLFSKGSSPRTYKSSFRNVASAPGHR
ncbi:hypothetical protein JCM33374_g3304 [Metschnikowia sp. JCM 33374]|nr:hypothetical protein JCM33374_g3304 [Metschnikowia sp. JCM 33374]